MNIETTPPPFQLTNAQRTCMGLTPVEESWEWAHLTQGTYECWACFDGDVIRKALFIGQNYYEECALAEQTLENRTKILPRNAKGKPRALTIADLERRPLGMHLRFSGRNNQLYLEHMETDRTYYETKLEQGGAPQTTEEFAAWARRWEEETTPEDLAELAVFLQAKKEKIPYQEGDFFRYRLGRREYGYGRILLDYAKKRKRKEPFWDVLNGPRPLVVKPYRILTTDPSLTPEQLRALPSMPSFHMEDRCIASGEYPIVGQLPLERSELDFPIMYGKCIPWQKEPKVIFYCGDLYRELEGAQPPPYCDKFQNFGVAPCMFLQRHLLTESVDAGDNRPYFISKTYDLRSLSWRPNLEEICAQMGLTLEEIPAKLQRREKTC